MPPLKDTTNNSLKLKNLTTLVRLLLSDLKEGCAKSDILFREELKVNYIQKAYEIYEDKVWIANYKYSIQTSQITSWKYL